MTEADRSPRQPGTHSSAERILGELLAGRGLSQLVFYTQVPPPNSSKPAAGYALVGELPSGFDQAAAEALITTRFEFKIKGDFVKADALEKERSAMGVKLNNRRGRRSWKFEQAE